MNCKYLILRISDIWYPSRKGSFMIYRLRTDVLKETGFQVCERKQRERRKTLAFLILQRKWLEMACQDLSNRNATRVSAARPRRRRGQWKLLIQKQASSPHFGNQTTSTKPPNITCGCIVPSSRRHLISLQNRNKPRTFQFLYWKLLTHSTCFSSVDVPALDRDLGASLHCQETQPQTSTLEKPFDLSTQFPGQLSSVKLPPKRSS